MAADLLKSGVRRGLGTGSCGTDWNVAVDHSLMGDVKHNSSSDSSQPAGSSVRASFLTVSGVYVGRRVAFILVPPAISC